MSVFNQPITRRVFLERLAAVAGGFTLVACNGRGGLKPVDCTAALPVVDAHTHIFNADDLPIAGFVNKVLPTMLGGEWGGVVSILARLLDGSLQATAPGFTQENARLDALLTGEADLVPLPEDDLQPFYEEFLRRYDALPNSDRQLLEQRISAEITADADTQFDVRPNQQPLRGFLSRRAGVTPVSPDADVIDVSSAALRVIEFAAHLSRYRYRNAEVLLHHFGEIENDIFLAATVDFDRWLDDSAKTSIAQQVTLMGKIARYTKGRILPLTGFDPWRDLASNGAALQVVQDAIMNQGTVGLKLYPPMGFRAARNVELDSQSGAWPSHAPNVDFGQALDDRLDALFAWCVSKDVPIMAHGSDSIAAGPGYGERASPQYWRSALQDHPNLRLSLGHSGGFEQVRDHDAWFAEVADLITTHPNVYCDFSHFDQVRKSGPRTHLAEAIGALVQDHPETGNKILYGTDWFMLVRAKDYKRYRRNFQRSLDELGDPALAGKIMGGNALDFLGLRPGDATRTRLEAFYAQGPHSVQPCWMGVVS